MFRLNFHPDASSCGHSRDFEIFCRFQNLLLVAGARARLPELEVSFTKEKSRVDVMQAVLFRQLREHYQQRDRLRLIVDYRRKFLDSLVRGGEEEAKQPET